MTFDGFTNDTLEFLADLAAHNDREWFAANRERYEGVLLGPERALVASLAEAFAAVDPRVRCEPAVNGSIFRINRDTRFSRDKSPYKTHADMWFWLGEDRKQSPGYFVRLVPDAVWVGGGRHFIAPEVLGTLRKAIAAEESGSELADIVAGLEADGYELGDQTLARVPRGFPADHPRAELLRFSVLHAIERTSPPPPEFASEAFAGWCMERFSRTRPLVEWLLANL